LEAEEELKAWVGVRKGLKPDVEKAVVETQPMGGEYGTLTRGFTWFTENVCPPTKPSFEVSKLPASLR
jgi:hypothetical protein